MLALKGFPKFLLHAKEVGCKGTNLFSYDMLLLKRSLKLVTNQSTWSSK